MKKLLKLFTIFVLFMVILFPTMKASAAGGDNKPPKPVLTQDITTVTDKSIKVTISNWGNAIKKEYKLDDGEWQNYTSPIIIDSNMKVYARGKDANGVESDIACLEITNIRKLLDKISISKKSATTVKVVYYDINDNEVGNGSGFIVSSDGLVVTNYHVIDMAPKVKVITSDNNVYNVLGVTSYDVKRDLAVLMLEDAKNLPAAILGNSDQLQLGEDVVAMGYPLDLQLTTTFGNISSLNVNGGSLRDGLGDIQMSAPISPGNSGGPLFNMYGEVVGINYSSIVKAQNINYSIPINEIKPLLESKNVKGFSDVIKEVYPKMDFSDYCWYLYYNYPDYKCGDYKFSFYDIDIVKPSDSPNEIDVYLSLSPSRFGEVLLAEFENNKDLVQKWVDDIYKCVKAIDPTKDVYVVVALDWSFNTRPTGYSDDEAYFNSKTNSWEIYKVELVYYYKNNTPNAVWHR